MTQNEEVARIAASILKVYKSRHTAEIKAASVGTAIGMIAATDPDPEKFLYVVNQMALITVEDIKQSESSSSK